jgi:hypothetical protein
LLAHRMGASSAKWSSLSKNVLTSIKRYYTSTFTDAEKQSSINLFLGRFRPYLYPSAEPLWALPTDAMLHESVRSHARPLWSTQWWVAPLQRFGVMLELAQARKPEVKLVRRTGNTKSFSRNNNSNNSNDAIPNDIVDIDFYHLFTAKVSMAFQMAYPPSRLSSFDEILARPYLYLHRATEDVEDRPLAGGTTTKAVKAEYATYLLTLSNWVQGNVLVRPTIQHGNVSNNNNNNVNNINNNINNNNINNSNNKSNNSQNNRNNNSEFKNPLDDGISSPNRFTVSAARVDLYRQYVDYPSTMVWEERSSERVRMGVYLDKCLDTALVDFSPDFLPSKAHYSAYLMDAQTFSFQPSYDSMHVYEEHLKTFKGEEVRLCCVHFSLFASIHFNSLLDFSCSHIVD